MLDAVTVRKPAETTWWWLAKAATGALIVVLIGLHFTVNHLIAQGGLLTYADVVAYYQNPAIPVIEILFLAVVVTHALVGLRGILLDLRPSPGVLNTVTVALFGVGIVSIIYGTWLIIVIVGRG